MFDNIEEYRDIIKMASSTMDAGYEKQGYSTTTSNGDKVKVSITIDTHDEYKKIINIQIDDGFDDCHINYDDVYHAFKNNTVKLSEDDPIYKVCTFDNSSNYNICRDELMKYITKCFNIDEKLTLNIVYDFPGTSIDMKIRAFSTMVRFVEKNQEVVDRDNILQESINAMNDYIENLE